MTAPTRPMPSVGERLSPALIREKARSIFSQERRRFVALLEGSGDAFDCEVGGQTVHVVAASSELDLRRKLSGLDAEHPDSRTLFLVDWLAGRPLARDLRARVAEGRVYQIRLEERLRPVFGANQLHADLLGSPLAKLAVRGEVSEFPRAATAALDLRLASLTWLRETLRGSWTPAELADEADLLGALRDADPTPWQRRWTPDNPDSAPEWIEWRRHVGELLGKEISAFSEIAWDLWSTGDLHGLPAVLWIAEALAVGEPDDGHVQLFRNEVDRWHPGLAAMLQPLFDRDLADPARVDRLDGLLRFGTASADDSELRVEPAELPRLLTSFGSASFLDTSPRLAHGLRARESKLTEALESFLTALQGAQSDPTPPRALLDAARLLCEHRAVAANRRERIEMGLRLTRWLWDAALHREARPSPGIDDALELARRFAGEGGFLDRARRRLAAEIDTTPLGRSWTRVRDAVESRLDALERRFAQGIADWSAHGRTTLRGCFGIEHAARELVAGFLRGTDGAVGSRRLLVLMMDGMSWSRCRELLDVLRASDWRPLRWRPTAATPVADSSRSPTGDAPYAMLAALPTITSISRSAFFAGAVPAPGKEPRTGDDPARWRDHPDLAGLGGPHGLTVHTKAVVETKERRPDPKALEDIRNPNQPLVAAIVNTFDDALKAGRSFDYVVSEETVGPVLDLLAAARSAGRAVLLVADHGHVLGDRFERLRPPPGADTKARWRVRTPGDSLEEDEVELGGGAWSPTPGQPVVLLSGERTSYGSQAHHGEHGGIARAEMVAPAILLGTPELAQSADGAEPDPELEPAAPWKPEWWNETGSAQSEVPETLPEPTAAEPAKGTGSLFEGASPEKAGRAKQAPRAAAGQKPQWLKEFEASELFRVTCNLSGTAPARRKQLVDHVLDVLPELVAHGGRVAAERIAQRTGTQLERLPGLISRLSSLVNAEGESCLWLDESTDLVRLDVPRFEALFELDTSAG